MRYLAIKLTVPGVESPIILALIKMLVNSLYFTMAELTWTVSQVPGYILPPFEKTPSQCFKIYTY